MGRTSRREGSSKHIMKILKVKSQSVPVYVTSQREESGQTQMSTLIATEIHPECGQQYAIALFGDRALVNYHEGELVMVAMNFQVRSNATSTYQAVYVEEIVKMDGKNITDFVSLNL